METAKVGNAVFPSRERRTASRIRVAVLFPAAVCSPRCFPQSLRGKKPPVNPGFKRDVCVSKGACGEGIVRPLVSFSLSLHPCGSAGAAPGSPGLRIWGHHGAGVLQAFTLLKRRSCCQGFVIACVLPVFTKPLGEEGFWGELKHLIFDGV